MASWNEIKCKVGKAANKVAAKTSEVADTASKHVKLKAMDGKLASKYEDIGRYCYKQSRNGESEAETIDKLMLEVDKLIADRKALREEIEADKQRRAEEKKVRAEAKAAEDAQDCDCE